MDISLLPHRPIETLNILYNFMQIHQKNIFKKVTFNRAIRHGAENHYSYKDSIGHKPDIF